MKRPKWAAQKRYKIVQRSGERPGLFYSGIDPWFRITECGRSKGSILSYTSGEVTRSAQGLCRRKTHTCCRGIHAYRTRASALDSAQEPNVVLSVWAKSWIGDGPKQRTRRVWVGRYVHRT